MGSSPSSEKKGENRSGRKVSGECGSAGLAGWYRIHPGRYAGGLEFSGVSTGSAHSCGVTTAGRVYCWGFNGNGQVCDGTNLNQRLTPVPVASALRFNSVLASHGAFPEPVRRPFAPVRTMRVSRYKPLHHSVRRAAELPTPHAEPTFMGMPDTLTPVYWTADMARRLPEDGNRYEVVYGELLVTPAPRLWHQELVRRLVVTLAKYLEANPLGLVLTSPADISWGADVLVQPDVFVVLTEQARTLEWSAVRDLLLVAEVLSPSTPRHDRFTKRRRYQEAGVPLYWIVDGDGHQVEVWTPHDAFPRIERDRLVWQPEGAGAPFTLPLQELFRAIE